MALRKPPISFKQYATYAKYLVHPVFRAAREVVMKRAEFRCGCGMPATEVHHIDYCRWGLFDPPSKLLPVCHDCHCILEGKSK